MIFFYLPKVMSGMDLCGTTAVTTRFTVCRLPLARSLCVVDLVVSRIRTMMVLGLLLLLLLSIVYRVVGVFTAYA